MQNNQDILKQKIQMLELEKNKYASRKASILSNLEWHFHYGDFTLINDLMVLALATITTGVLIGLASFPLFFTPAFFLPTIWWTLAFIGLMSILILSFLDKKQANEQFDQLNSHIIELNKEADSLDFTKAEVQMSINYL